MRNWLKVAALCLFVVGCSSWNRSCASFGAHTLGADWLVVQFDSTGRPFNCWMIDNATVSNEEAGDGIWWLDQQSGHIIHIAGWYNRVQVTGNDYGEAAQLLGVDVGKCTQGRYDS